VYATVVIYSIQFRYGDTWAPAHGGTGGGVIEAYLDAGEYIVSITIVSGTYVDQVTINTNVRSIGPCGGAGGGASVAQGPAGTRLSYITGKSGDWLNQLTFYFINNA
jgi:hypothetical protein